MGFYQEPPNPGNEYRTDAVLQGWLRRRLPAEAFEAAHEDLDRMGALCAGELDALCRRWRRAEPELVNFDPWGRRIDEVVVPPAWERFAEVAVEFGLVALAHERPWGEWSRLHQFALAYLFQRSSMIYNCPLAMTDGAVRSLLAYGDEALKERALPRLLSRDPSTVWTAGQWMTERIGGSDVSRTETVARRDGDAWRLYGDKWFTSAITADVALTLARPEGNPPGNRGLALFYLELRRPDGSLNGIRIHRLKEKLGTRMLPTAELTLDGAVATPVGGLDHGVRRIATVLNTTRVWNAVAAIGTMRHAIALARDYARRRRAFGRQLAAMPLHRDVLAWMQAEFAAAFALTFEAARLMGRVDAGTATGDDRTSFRLLTSLVKLTTAKQAVAVASEVVEAFGGMGYVEDTGIPMLLRDAQVLPIWEGATNVLSLDALQVIGETQALDLLTARIEELVRPAEGTALEGAARTAREAVCAVRAFLGRAEASEVERAGRAVALTLGRSLALALLVDDALRAPDEALPAAAARRFAAHGVDLLTARPALDPDEDAALALG